MIRSPLDIIESVDVALPTALEATEPAQPPKLDLATLPAVVVSGTALIDFSQTQSVVLRSSISLALLFGSRVATKAMKDGDDEDDWLAKYIETLGSIGFRISGQTMTRSTFKKLDTTVHKAIIPFLTLALGPAVAASTVLLKLLEGLQSMNADSPWITLFDRQSRRFNVREMHFAVVGGNDVDTTITYAVARLNVDTNTTQILFFKITKATAEFESSTTQMTADNGLLATIEPKLKAKLLAIIDDTIAGADV